jgi:hypothetical protein
MPADRPHNTMVCPTGLAGENAYPTLLDALFQTVTQDWAAYWAAISESGIGS